MLHQTPENLARAVPVTTPSGKMWAEQEALEAAPPSRFQLKRNRKGFAVWAWLMEHYEPTTASYISASAAGALRVQKLRTGHECYGLTNAAGAIIGG